MNIILFSGRSSSTPASPLSSPRPRGSAQYGGAAQQGGPFPMTPHGRRGQGPRIRHTGPGGPQASLNPVLEQRNAITAENHNFLKDVVDQVVAGDGVGWLKLSRLRKLMEDKNYRNMILPKLNRSLDCAGSPDDHIQDVVRQCESDADMCTS